MLDDEMLVRWFVPRKDWYEPPNRPTTLNFKLRQDERGLSVYRLSRTTESALRTRYAIPATALFLTASVGDVRALAKADGTPLNLDVEPDNPDHANPGHAVIVSPDGSISAAAAKALRDCFAKSSTREE